MALSPKQDLFCREYLVDLNATQAYIRAGYSPRGARQSAGRLLTNADIEARLRALMDERSERVGIKADDVLRELGRIGLFDIRKVVEWGGGDVRFVPSHVIDDDTAAAIQEVKAEVMRSMPNEDDEDAPPMQVVKMSIKMASKVAALTKLGEHLGLFQSETQKPPPTPPEPATYRPRDMSGKRSGR